MKSIQTKINKLAMFTDIHWGARGNSVQHNQDNLDYLEWFIANLDSDVTHIGFLGDWFEHRNAINVQSLQMCTEGIKKLDALGLPIIFLTGNHDLYRRHTRDVHSLNIFGEMKNVILVDSPMWLISGSTKILAVPYLFENEYISLVDKVNEADVVLGHLEFKGFVLTGYNTVMEHGPDHKMWSKPKKVFTGHFHKRQVVDNVIYIGNVFPTNFGDAGDIERGMAIYDVDNDDVEFRNWDDCPKYEKVNLSKVIEGNWKPAPKTKVKCVIDVDLSYNDAQALREGMIAEFDLRDFVLEEDRAVKQGLLEGENFRVEESIMDFSGIDDLVVKQLEAAKSDSSVKVDLDRLIAIYKELKIDENSIEVDE